MKKARVILLYTCPKRCSYCCNLVKPVMNTAIKISSIDEVVDSDIMLTGGEPALIPSTVLEKVLRIRKLNPNAKVYMYTAMDVALMHSLMQALDGIQYTLHENTTQRDIDRFHSFQNKISSFKFHETKSFRLYIHPSVKLKVTIMPWLWSRVEVKPWIPAEEMHLPEGETLYELNAGEIDPVHPSASKLP